MSITYPPATERVATLEPAGDRLAELGARLPNEAAAYEFLETIRWRGDPVCPHCDAHGGHVFLRPANGLSRTTNRGRQSERRVWKCRDCKRQFSVITGTVMHGTHVPIRTWVLVTYEIAAMGASLSERDVQRRYGLTSKSAHFLLQRVRDDLRRERSESIFADVADAGRTAPVREDRPVLVGLPSDATPPDEHVEHPEGIIVMW